MTNFSNIFQMAALLQALLWFLIPISGSSQSTPSAEEMQRLEPKRGSAARLIDRSLPKVSRMATEAHRRYTNPEVLQDIQTRLSRIAESGRPENVLTKPELQQLEVNLERLRELELEFLAQRGMQRVMNVAASWQQWLTTQISPLPPADKLGSKRKEFTEAARKNNLYKNWDQQLPSAWIDLYGPSTWGELLLSFNESTEFRETWLTRFPESLPDLLELHKSWAWEDSSIRSIRVKNLGTASEYWIFKRRNRENHPNFFKMKLAKDFSSVMEAEYSGTLFFNRITRIIRQGRDVVYEIESIEKGRTMQPYYDLESQQIKHQTFPGANLLRISKADEFPQRKNIADGTLRLFLGPRTLLLDQVHQLMATDPHLLAAVGQFGFSVTGGRAQAVSIRTDEVNDLRIKLTAALIDLIDFANVADVEAWFRNQKKLVFRAISGGVGAGGNQAITNKNSTTQRNSTPKNEKPKKCGRIFPKK